MSSVNYYKSLYICLFSAILLLSVVKNGSLPLKLKILRQFYAMSEITSKIKLEDFITSANFIWSNRRITHQWYYYIQIRKQYRACKQMEEKCSEPQPYAIYIGPANLNKIKNQLTKIPLNYSRHAKS